MLLKYAGSITIETHIVDDSFSLGCLNGIQRNKARTFCICENLYSQKITNLTICGNFYSQNKQKQIKQNSRKLVHAKIKTLKVVILRMVKKFRSTLYTTIMSQACAPFWNYIWEERIRNRGNKCCRGVILIVSILPT